MVQLADTSLEFFIYIIIIALGLIINSIKNKKSIDRKTKIDNYDKYCKKCTHFDYDPHRGIICGLNNEKPDFGLLCNKFEKDKERTKRVEYSQQRHLKAQSKIDQLGEDASSVY